MAVCSEGVRYARMRRLGELVSYWVVEFLRHFSVSLRQMSVVSHTGPVMVELAFEFHVPMRSVIGSV